MATIHEIDIRKYTWWVSSDRRLFLIAEIRLSEDGDGIWRPGTIGLLDVLSEEVVYRPWIEICGLYDSKSLKKASAAIKEDYLTKKLIKL